MKVLLNQFVAGNKGFPCPESWHDLTKELFIAQQTEAVNTLIFHSLNVHALYVAFILNYCLFTLFNNPVH